MAHAKPVGRRALRAWIAEPTGLPRIQDEAVVRVLAGDLADDADILRSLETLRTEIAEQRERLNEAERVVETLPHRERYLRLVHRLGRLELDARERWLDEVVRELS